MIKNRSRVVKPRYPIGTPMHTAIEYVLLLIGSFLIAVSFNLFLAPNEIASGGVSGISIIVRGLLGIEPAITQWALNIPLFFAGVLLLGGKFGLKTAVGTAVSPLFVLLTSSWAPLTSNPLLASIFGGLGVGAGSESYSGAEGPQAGWTLPRKSFTSLPGSPSGFPWRCSTGP